MEENLISSTENNFENIKLFNDKKIRVEWKEDEEKWYFSIVDVVAILTDSEYQKARNYWKVLKSRLKDEGNESVTNCNQLKMKSTDGKYYNLKLCGSKSFIEYSVILLFSETVYILKFSSVNSLINCLQ